MRRKGLLVGAWALATLAATLVGWGAVRQVTAEVSPAQTLPFPSAVALADDVSDPGPATDSPASERPREPAARPQRTAPPDPPAPVVPDEPAADPAPERDQPPAEQRPREESSTTQAYTLTGGVVTVRYRGGSTTLVSATPNSGFGVDVNDSGPGKVDVRFRSDRHESRLVTRMRNGVPDPEQEERPR